MFFYTGAWGARSAYTFVARGVLAEGPAVRARWGVGGRTFPRTGRVLCAKRKGLLAGSAGTADSDGLAAGSRLLVRLATGLQGTERKVLAPVSVLVC